MTRTVRVTIEGKTPLLMHAFPMEPITALEKKPKEEQAEYAAYRHPDTRELYIPGVSVQRGLVSAGKYTKGKGRASLQQSVAACVLVSPDRVGLGVDQYAIDSRPVVVPATKGRVVRHRPRLDAWSGSFELEFDDDLISTDQMRQIVDDLGSRVGILDYRPECKGPYGRFRVTHWDLVPVDAKKSRATA